MIGITVKLTFHRIVLSKAKGERKYGTFLRNLSLRTGKASCPKSKLLCLQSHTGARYRSFRTGFGRAIALTVRRRNVPFHGCYRRSKNMKKVLIFTALLAVACIGFAGIAKADTTSAGGVTY